MPRTYLGFILVVVAAGLLSFGVAGTAQAASITSETFDGYTLFPDTPVGDPSNWGVPLVIEGADSPFWMAARIDAGDSDPVANDVAVQQFGTGSSEPPDNGTPVGRAGDQAALVLRLDLTNYTNVMLQFDWRTLNAETVDRAVVAYYQGDGTAFQPDGLGTPNNTYDWYNDPQLGNGSLAWYQNNFTELMRKPRSDPFQSESFALPGGDILYLAFWLDNLDAGAAQNDHIKIDNVVVTGDFVVPEPATGVLLAFGLAMLASLGVRRRGN